MSTFNSNISQTSRTNLMETIELKPIPAQNKSRFSDTNEESMCSSIIGSLMILAMILLIMTTFPLSLLFCFAVIHDHERAVLFRNGRLLSGMSEYLQIFV